MEDFQGSACENCGLHDRLKKMEEKLEKVADAVHDIEIAVAENEKDFSYLKETFIELKEFVETQQTFFLNRVWKLVIGMILILSTITAALLGIKNIPDLF